MASVNEDTRESGSGLAMTRERPGKHRLGSVNLEGTTDGGYPSTVQLPDGSLVTAYYSNGVTQHRRYHMGVVRWELPD